MRNFSCLAESPRDVASVCHVEACDFLLPQSAFLLLSTTCPSSCCFLRATSARAAATAELAPARSNGLMK